MQRTLLTLLIVLMGGLQLQAQFLPTSNLTVFSEDGFKFYLILNGERQNDVPQTNIRVEELPNPYYSCKIIFEDKTQKEITKGNLMLVDAEGVHQDVTYKIRKDKSGKQVMRFHSFIPAIQNMQRPANTMVYRYGNPSPFMRGNDMIETTVVEMRHGNGRNDAVLDISVGEGGASIQVRDPELRTQTTTVTTTTRTTTREREYNQRVMDDGFATSSPEMGCQGYPMSPGDFSKAMNSVKGQSFEEGKLRVAKQVANANCLKVNQIKELIHLFSFEASKLDFAKAAFRSCTDPKNYFQLNDAFTFESSREDLDKFISNQ